MFKIDIIVPTFNRPKLLNRCLNSIKKSYSKNFRIIVIDDGSSLEELVDKKPTTTKSLIKNKFDKFVKYIPCSRNGGLGQVFTVYKNLPNKSEFMIVINDDDQLISDKPINKAINRLTKNKLISFVCISLRRQSDDFKIDHKLNLNYPEMSGKEFIKNYIDNEDLQHTTMYGVFRTKYINLANCLISKNLCDFGLQDAFGIDSDFLFRMATMGDVSFINETHVLRRETEGITEKYPVSFAYCYYIYIRDVLQYVEKSKNINKKYKKKFLSYWLKIMLMMFSSSLFDQTPKERGDENIKRHLKMPLHLFIIVEMIKIRSLFDNEMIKLYLLTLKKKLNPSLQL